MIPTYNNAEIQYVLHCYLDTFLGYEYQIETREENHDYVFQIAGKSFVIKNHFFDSDDTNNLYRMENIPASVDSGSLTINNSEFSIVSLYGKSKISKEGDVYILDADIVASAFFMLTRWEEKVDQRRDQHNRFEGKNSLAHRLDFLERPVVNEYCELLDVLLKTIGCGQERKKRTYTIVPTHDVDNPYLWWNTGDTLRTISSSALKLNYSEFSAQMGCILKRKDPYDTHGLFMDLSERSNTLSHFFFMSGGTTIYDNRYTITNKRIVDLMQVIKQRGHSIGFHPSYDTYRDERLFAEEKARLEEANNCTITTGRQHYLRFDINHTFQIWNDNAMEWDSTMTYADRSGFRCGVCYPFPVYDLKNRKILDLFERPLIHMDATLFGYEKLSKEMAIQKIINTKERIQKYKGEYVFLWHNSSFVFGNYKESMPALLEMYRMP